MNTKINAEGVLAVAQKLDPKVAGNVEIIDHAHSPYLTGTMISSVENFEQDFENGLHETYPDWAGDVSINFVSYLNVQEMSVSQKNGRKNKVESQYYNPVPENDLSEIDTLYSGNIAIEQVSENTDFKRVNWETQRKVSNCIEALGFMQPLILDAEKNVIDGNLRLRIAKDLKWKKVPVQVVNVVGKRAEFIRLVLNRSVEFQNWYYGDDTDSNDVHHKGVDTFMDETPQLDPLLAPLGFFGERILPTKYFGQTVYDYTIDQDHDQQSEYKQELGLAKWAEIQRERVKEQMDKKRGPKIADKKSMNNLFDIEVSEDELTETYDMDEELKDYISNGKEIANTITNNYDAKMRKIKEESGKEWQNRRRSTKEKTKDNRLKRLNEKSDDHNGDDMTEDSFNA